MQGVNELAMHLIANRLSGGFKPVTHSYEGTRPIRLTMRPHDSEETCSLLEKVDFH